LEYGTLAGLQKQLLAQEQALAETDDTADKSLLREEVSEDDIA